MFKILKQITLSPSVRAAVLLLWVCAALIVPNVWLSITEPLSALAVIANLMLPAGMYLLLLSLSRKTGRTVLWLIPLISLAGFQAVLLFIYGRSVIAVDMFLNFVTTNPSEASELLVNLLPVLIAITIIYVFPMGIAVWAAVKRWMITRDFQKITMRIALVITSIGIAAITLCFILIPSYNPLIELYPVNALYNVGLAVDRTARLADYPRTSAGYTFNATSVRPDSVPEIYVAVVGETSRADNWQLFGYSRPTTPRLIDREGLVSYGKALSQSNTTHKSVPLLLSALSADNFGDSIYVSKSLITAFKEAGFHTAFISNQNRNHSFIDRFGREADTCIFIRDGKPINAESYDSDLLAYLDREIAKGHRKLLVVLHTYGSHFNYIDRYPSREAVFKPDGPAEAIKQFRKQQVNAYDNTILHTSNFIADIVERLDSMNVNAAMIYTSDHGEDIFDDERNLFLHASPCPSYYQVHVPFLVWMSPELIASHPTMYNAALANRSKCVASSVAFFNTLLQLAGVKTDRMEQTESVVDVSYREHPYCYLNDHNKCVGLGEAGFLDKDFRLLDSLLHK